MQLTARPYSPYLNFSGSVQEHRSLDFFHARVATILSGYFDTTFWTHVVPRVGASEPSVKHAMIALASLYETIPTRDRQLSREQQRRTLLQYNKAIKSLKERLGTGEQALEVTLLTCVLFICLEFMRGNPNIALDHLHSGLQILDTTQRSTQDAQSIEEELVNIFSRLSIQASLWGRRPPQICASKDDDPMRDFDSACTPFATIREARVSLERILIQRLRPSDPHIEFDPSMPMSDVWKAERERLTAQLRYWNSRHGLSMAVSVHANDIYSLRILQMMAIVAIVWNSIPLIPEETAFDRHLFDFEIIVSLAAVLIDGKAPCSPQAASVATSLSSETTSASHRPNFSALSNTPIPFTFEMGIIPCLYFTAIKCRSPSVRRKAIRLLSIVIPEQEGLWHARMLAKIASRMTQLEEEGHPPTEVMSTWPLEEGRIHAAYIHSNYSLDERTQQVNFIWRPGGLRGEWKDWIEVIAY